ncbi:hypothetical protein ABC347_01805 [Sphingomonas sp. 1P06PA]|uniref:hypothetical protein n=1 Tax=Sphingomonas sp. 1P06PA TaxID=554121 RepID=UPI0039A6EC75
MHALKMMMPLLLFGCGQGEGAEQRTVTQATREGASVSPMPEGRGGKARIDKGGGTLPATATFDYTGDWAATADLCAGGRWRFTRDGVSTAGETSCTGRAIDESADRITLDYACTAEGLETQERWTIDHLADNRIRVVRAETNGKPIGDVTLQSCPTAAG